MSKTLVVGKVPCGDCHMCCRNELVELTNDEVDFKTEPHPTKEGRRVLAHAENRDCIYLASYGCSIHHLRPQICRDFDCRYLALKLTKSKAKKLKCGETWKRGRELLREVTP